MTTTTAGSSVGTVDFDVIVIGAGFGGLRMMHEVRRLGLSGRVLEAGTDVGGTWFWNRYPGARTDSESWDYVLSFSDELLQEWDWSERYPTQREVHEYLQHIADRFDLRRDISFATRVVSAAFDETANIWTVTTADGESMSCTYLVSAAGLLSAALEPQFPGLEAFKGDWYMTARWPSDPVDLSGKRVGVIGTGATGVQIVPAIAETAEHVTVFQRTPNYVLPRRDRPIDDAERAAIKSNYSEIIENARNHFFGFSMGYAGRISTDVTPEEHQRILEDGWEKGGFGFIFNTFDDIFVDEQSAEVASEFIRTKIRETVKDPATAELLCPTTYPLAAKRPPLGAGYYEAFNRDNVTLIGVGDNPIVEITPDGLRTETEHYELDVIIFATGFDAATGALTSIDLRGRGGRTIADTWSSGPRTHLGIAVDGFPNLFMISGPQSPFANIPVVIDNTVNWIGRAIEHSRNRGDEGLEATPTAVENWRQHMDELLAATILGKGEKVHSWFLGANVPGKPHQVLFYFGGVNTYFAECERVIENDFEGFTPALTPVRT